MYFISDTKRDRLYIYIYIYIYIYTCGYTNRRTQVKIHLVIMHDAKGLNNISQNRLNFTTRYTLNEIIIIIIIIYKGIPLSLVIKNSNQFNISTVTHARAYMCRYRCLYIYTFFCGTATQRGSWPPHS
jgi:hypothetical protein